MASIGEITVPVNVEPSERLKALIAEEVARQLKDIRNLPLDELAKAIGEKLARHIRMQGIVQSGGRCL